MVLIVLLSALDCDWRSNRILGFQKGRMNNPAFFVCVDGVCVWGQSLMFERERVSPYGGRSAQDYVSFEDQTERANMLLTIAIILIVLWLLGLISSYTLGGWIHLLLIAAIIAFVVQLFMGPRRGPPVA
jgi:hypothetical protein